MDTEGVLRAVGVFGRDVEREYVGVNELLRERTHDTVFVTVMSSLLDTVMLDDAVTLCDAVLGLREI